MTSQDGALSQRVFEELESRIIARVYPPGMRLIEDDVAVGLGVSRTPVREAFRLLERAGWLELRPHLGAYVRAATVDEVREIFEVRQTLEARAAELAAQRSAPDEQQRLGALLDEGRVAVGDRRWERVAAVNTEFHATISVMARNAVLHRMLKDLSKQIAWHFSAVAGLRGSDSWNEHEQLVTAIASGDGSAAGAIAMQHSRRTRDAFVENLFELGDLRIS